MVAPGEAVLLTHQLRASGRIDFALHVRQRVVARGQLAVHS